MFYFLLARNLPDGYHFGVERFYFFLMPYIQCADMAISTGVGILIF
jgi:hypothetical protein